MRKVNDRLRRAVSMVRMPRQRCPVAAGSTEIKRVRAAVSVVNYVARKNVTRAPGCRRGVVEQACSRTRLYTPPMMVEDPRCQRRFASVRSVSRSYE